jgi:hypothetical protein
MSSKNFPLIHLFASTLLVAFSTQLFAADFVQELPLDSADLTHVEISLGAVDLEFSSHSGSPFVRIEVDYEEDDFNPPNVEHGFRDGHPFLRLSNEKGDKDHDIFSKRDLITETWKLSFSRDALLQLNLEFGLGSANLDLGGMWIESFVFASGLSDVELDFSTPVRAEVKYIELATGLGSMHVDHLLNAKPMQLGFAGGMGSTTLSLTGEKFRDCDLTLAIGMGSLQLQLLKGYGVKVKHNDSFLATHNFPGLLKIDEDLWSTPDWDEDAGNLVVDLSVGMGSVSIDWVE